MTTTLRHADELAVVVGNHRVVVLDLDHLDDPPVILTDSAAAIWEAIDGRLDDEGVVARVARGFGLQASEIRDQVLAFLQQLLALHLIVTA